MVIKKCSTVHLRDSALVALDRKASRLEQLPVKMSNQPEMVPDLNVSSQYRLFGTGPAGSQLWSIAQKLVQVFGSSPSLQSPSIWV
jgi:hypothetical protein